MSPEDRLENVTQRLIAAFEELDFVHTLAGVLANPEGIQDFDRYLLEETSAIIGADCGWVIRESWDVSATLGEADADTLTRILVRPLAREKELPFLVDDLPRHLMRRSLEIPLDSVPRAFLAVPLTVRKELLGVLCLGRVDPGRAFGSGDQRLLETLASQAALFIKNADLVQRFRHEAVTLGRRLERLQGPDRDQPDITWLKGRSRSMRSLARQVESAAATEANVLLLGESGTGKSLVSRVIHRTSALRQGPFVEINCGAVPAALIESELFGHARGAFTGADRDRPGLFEEANGGTILLDEIADLPLESQVKLLTVLERKSVRRVGENKDRPAGARVIAATNADLEARVSGGRFREDLFYRLNVFRINVPPLRERREDILPLARRFLDELSRETHRKVSGFSREAEAALLDYAWPGNIRELRNVLERGILLVDEGGMLEVADLPFSRSTPRPRVVDGKPFREAVEGFERQLLVQALEATGGVVSEAAARLQISRTNLHNKLRKHGLTRVSQWRQQTAHKS